MCAQAPSLIYNTPESHEVKQIPGLDKRIYRRFFPYGDDGGLFRHVPSSNRVTGLLHHLPSMNASLSYIGP